MDIAVIGAQGHLGSALCRRLTEICDDSIHLHPTVNKDHSAELASTSDVILIVVRPNDVSGVLAEISPSLKRDARIVSFAAMYPLASVSRLSDRPSARILTDPWWNISAYVLDKDFPKRGLGFLFEKLTKKAPIEVKTDAEVDQMSVLISYIFAATLLQRAGEIDAREHLRFLSRHPLVGVLPEKIMGFAPEGDVEAQLKTLATKGGVTDRVLRIMREEPDVKPEQLFERVLRSLYPSAR